MQFHNNSVVNLFCKYLFVFNIDVHFLGADGLADVVDVIFSAVIKYVFILFPDSHRNRREKREMLAISSSETIRFCAWLNDTKRPL